jgi:polysaccharide biosynthesis transport protein
MRKRILSPDELMLTQSGNAGGALLTGHESEEQHRNVFRLLWRRRWGIIAVTLLCLGGAAIYLHRAPLIFTSEAQVYVQQPNATAAGDPSQVSSADSYLYLQSELIKTDSILKPVSQLPQIAAQPSMVGQPDLIRALQNSLDVELDNHLGILTIRYSSRSADEAVTIVNAILEQYRDSHANPTAGTSSSTDVLKIIENEQSTQAAALLAAQKAVTDFREANSAMTFGSLEKGNIVMDKLASLSVEFTNTQLAILRAKEDFEEILTMKDSTDVLWRFMQNHPIGTDPDPEIIRARKLDNDIQDLQLSLDSKTAGEAANPAVMSAHATLLVLQQKFEDAKHSACANYVTTLKQNFDEAKTRFDDLSNQYDKQQQLARSLNDVSAQFEMLKENVDRQQKLADAVDNRISALKSKQAEDVLDVRVLKKGDKQQLDISPRYYRTMGMAGIMGLVLGLVCAFLLDMADGRIHSVEEVRSSLGMRVLGAIPHVRGVHLVTNLGRGVDLYPAAEIAEAFRIVRTAIHLKMQARRTRPILVTSPQQGEGKTVVSSNLAIAMAKSGRRTILVDADMRSPMMHCIHTVSNARGLFNVLCGELTVSQAVLPSGIDRLDIMPAGPTPPNPAELLNDIRFNQMVKDLCAAYDAVIIDAPPVIPVADPAIISAWCKTTILVMRARKSNLKEGQESLDRLAAAGASVLGVVVNDVPQRHGQYGYYGSASAPRPRRALPTVSTGTTTTAKSAGPQRVELIDPDGAVRYAHEDQDEDGNGRADSNGNGHGNGNGHASVAVSSNGNGSADGNGNGAAH